MPTHHVCCVHKHAFTRGKERFCKYASLALFQYMLHIYLFELTCTPMLGDIAGGSVNWKSKFCFKHHSTSHNECKRYQFFQEVL